MDYTAAHELELYIINDGDLYRQHRAHIEQNLLKKLQSSAYDHEKAKILWGHLVNNGAKKYVKEFADMGEQFTFDAETKKATAESLADLFLQKVKAGDFGEEAKEQAAQITAYDVALDRYQAEPSHGDATPALVTAADVKDFYNLDFLKTVLQELAEHEQIEIPEIEAVEDIPEGPWPGTVQVDEFVLVPSHDAGAIIAINEVAKELDTPQKIAQWPSVFEDTIYHDSNIKDSVAYESALEDLVGVMLAEMVDEFENQPSEYGVHSSKLEEMYEDYGIDNKDDLIAVLQYDIIKDFEGFILKNAGRGVLRNIMREHLDPYKTAESLVDDYSWDEFIADGHSIELPSVASYFIPDDQVGVNNARQG